MWLNVLLEHWTELHLKEMQQQCDDANEQISNYNSAKGAATEIKKLTDYYSWQPVDPVKHKELRDGSYTLICMGKAIRFHNFLIGERERRKSYTKQKKATAARQDAADALFHTLSMNPSVQNQVMGPAIRAITQISASQGVTGNNLRRKYDRKVAEGFSYTENSAAEMLANDMAESAMKKAIMGLKSQKKQWGLTQAVAHFTTYLEGYRQESSKIVNCG